MHTLQALVITLSVLFIGFIILTIVMQIAQMITKKKFSVHSLFFNFRQKMWMTIGLGILFFGLYACLVWLGSFQLDSKTKLDLFFKAYNNPTDFIFAGLLIFSSFSIAIYMARMCIIYLYNSKKR